MSLINSSIRILSTIGFLNYAYKYRIFTLNYNLLSEDYIEVYVFKHSIRYALATFYNVLIVASY